ncbi:MAG: hypothetical protein BAA01_07500 [Bacillus thermozeamaize]|uniref:Uncharacterized protein n=1 Tax=Bacillus thermozeamaize TaxID=230954 RepID=A0A1Y3PU01_9BACI|nr:MAG: hypothetical protein BAA01_07500 [Bacillus thermozeamaize]
MSIDYWKHDPMSSLLNGGRARHPATYFWELRVFTIWSLQDRRYIWEDRLLGVGFFFRKADELAQIAWVDEIPDFIGSYLDLIDRDDLHEQFTVHPLPILPSTAGLRACSETIALPPCHTWPLDQELKPPRIDRATVVPFYVTVDNVQAK